MKTMSADVFKLLKYSARKFSLMKFDFDVNFNVDVNVDVNVNVNVNFNVNVND